jgi:uncharacterized protein YabN with tetrapyrrole methylase and pyrophosphatase domain
MESDIRANDLKMSKMSLELLDQFWRKAKRETG